AAPGDRQDRTTALSQEPALPLPGGGELHCPGTAPLSCLESSTAPGAGSSTRGSLASGRAPEGPPGADPESSGPDRAPQPVFHDLFPGCVRVDVRRRGRRDVLSTAERAFHD